MYAAMMRLHNLLYDLRAATLCRAGVHCAPARGVRKYDGGRCPVLCRYCYRIIENWRFTDGQNAGQDAA